MESTAPNYPHLTDEEPEARPLSHGVSMGEARVTCLGFFLGFPSSFKDSVVG